MATERTEDKMSEDLAARRIVYVRAIGRNTGEELSEQLLRLQMEDGTKPIHLLINSGGGGSDSATTLHDLISYVLTVPVIATVVGKCGSAATLILLACKVRRSTPHAQFLIHSGMISGVALKMDDLTPIKIGRLNAETQKFAKDMIDFYVKKLKLSPQRVKKLIARGDEDFDSLMSAKEALDIRLITEIVTDKVNLFPLSVPKKD